MSDANGSGSVSDHSEMFPILIVPVGAFEQHGPHLPFDTDTQIAVAVSRAATAELRGENIAVAQGSAISISASDEHRGFPGTLSIGTEGCATVLVAIARSATWTRGVIFANGHGGNADAIHIATKALHDGGVPHAFWSVTGFSDNDSHAGYAETSLMLHIAPEAVNTDRMVPGNTQRLVDIMPTMRQKGVAGVSPNGVLGDPRGASAEFGAELFASNVTSLVAMARQCHTRWK